MLAADEAHHDEPKPIGSFTAEWDRKRRYGAAVVVSSRTDEASILAHRGAATCSLKGLEQEHVAPAQRRLEACFVGGQVECLSK